jgi:acetolactate synthase I/II/III large subunit
MAEGYSRATGKMGVVLVTSGSGITNLVTPMQDALCDGTPMVVLCGHAPLVGRDEFQAVDVLSVSMPCTKWNSRVRSIEELPRQINEAFEVAVSGRPGPVLLEIPRNVISSTLLHGTPTISLLPNTLSAVSFHALNGSFKSIHETLDRVARLVNMAKKPVLYVGQGMLAHPEGPSVLKEFADKSCIPVTTSLQGLGAFDELDCKALHMLGLHGTGYANMAIQEADLIIALGARFDDRITGSIAKFAPRALAAAMENRGGIVHFEIAPKNVNKVVQVTEAVLGDCAINLRELTALVTPVSKRPEWFAEISSWKSRFNLSAYKEFPTPGKIKAQAVVEKLSELTAHMKQDTIITTGVGQHQMWAAQYFRWRHPRTMITSGGLGTMGFGIPAAIGAKLARPNCLVIDIDGDASFNMTMVELATAARYNIGIKVLLCNNEEMGMVSDLQRLYYNGQFVHNRQTNPDFVLASNAFGVAADYCNHPADVEEKLKWLIYHDGPAVLEIKTDKNSPVWPVVPAGKGLHEFITYPEILEEKRISISA